MMKKQKLAWFVVQTSINCKGEASVYARAVANNGWESIWTPNLLDPRIQYFDTEEEAKQVVSIWSSSDQSVHSRWVDAE